MEEKILEHIGNRLLTLNKPTESRLEEEKQSSARYELKLILEIFANKGVVS